MTTDDWLMGIASGIAAFIVFLALVLFVGCSGGGGIDPTPTLVVCQEGGKVVFQGVVRRDAVRPCFWDIGHNGTCIDDMVFGPAVPCMYAPHRQAPQPTAVATAQPSPEPTQEAKRK